MIGLDDLAKLDRAEAGGVQVAGDPFTVDGVFNADAKATALGAPTARGGKAREIRSRPEAGTANLN